MFAAEYKSIYSKDMKNIIMYIIESKKHNEKSIILP